MMIALAFIACLTAPSGACAEHNVLLLPEAGLMGCMATAPLQLAQWSETHPGQRIARWSCHWHIAGESDA
jgi:hypothetical protein